MKYDKSATLFSDEGELLQVVYAQNAASRGSSIVSAPCKEGDLFLFSLPLSTTQSTSGSQTRLLDRRSIDNVAKIHDQVWVAFSGLAGDGRSILKQARNFAVEFNLKYGFFPSASTIASHIGEVQHAVTLSGDRRPYGIQVLTIGYDDLQKSFCVHLSEPSGEVSSWNAVAIGKDSRRYIQRMEQLLGDDMKYRPKKDIVSFFQEVLTPIGISSSSDNNEETVVDMDNNGDISNNCMIYCFHHNKETNKIEMRCFSTVTEFVDSMK